MRCHRSSTCIGEPQHPGNYRQNQIGITKRSQLGNNNAIIEVRRNLGGGMERKTRLPDASRAGQGDDSDIVLSKPGNDCGDFMIAANERRSRPQQGGMECACMCRTRRQWGQAMLGSLM